MAGLVPAIHVLCFLWHQEDVDARDERGHDEGLVNEDYFFAVFDDTLP